MEEKFGMQNWKQATLFGMLALSLHALIAAWLWTCVEVELPAQSPSRVTEVMFGRAVQPNLTRNLDAVADVSPIDRNVQNDVSVQSASPVDGVPDDSIPRYFSARELDERPYPVDPVIVPYPDVALGKPSGRVILRLLIDAKGKVQQASLVSSEVPEEFEKAVIDAFSGAVMIPGKLAGQPVGAEMVIAVDFEQQ